MQRYCKAAKPSLSVGLMRPSLTACPTSRLNCLRSSRLTHQRSIGTSLCRVTPSCTSGVSIAASSFLILSTSGCPEWITKVVSKIQSKDAERKTCAKVPIDSRCGPHLVTPCPGQHPNLIPSAVKLSTCGQKPSAHTQSSNWLVSHKGSWSLHKSLRKPSHFTPEAGTRKVTRKNRSIQLISCKAGYWWAWTSTANCG